MCFHFSRLLRLWILLFVLPMGIVSARANSAGGFTTLVTTSVTTGTETVNGHADRYLDNGILHVSIQGNGSIDSIKYLKPGLSGTPKANGVETVSQSGVNFGNHTAIYYYWYPDGNGDCVYSNTVIGETNIDICFVRPFSQANGDQVVADIELHYLLGEGNTGLYVYIIVRHPSIYATFGDLNISFIQSLWPTAHDETNFLCENSYVDDGVRYGLNLNGEFQKRYGLQPNFWDNYHTVGVLGMPKEIVQYTTGAFAGSTNGKYSYTFDFPKLSTFGMASDANHIGLWYVMGGHEYQNNGPTACEYSGGIGGIIGFEPIIAHYGNTGLSVGSNADFTKIYGPWLLYINSQTNGYACWQDSQQQALAEQAAWPYAWLTNSVYESRGQRATVSGRLVINDPLRPQALAAGAWVGLAHPDSGLENDPDNWQWQSADYQFWTQCAEDGSFTLPPVTTVSPYGTNALYELYVYCAGTNGSVGQFRTGPFTFSPGEVTNLGTLTWTPLHSGNSMVWEIGRPDRTATEFRHGDDYAIPGLWLDFANEFPNPMTYTIGASNPSNDWNYVQGAYFTNGTAENMIWNIQFNLTNLPTSGNMTLNTVWAGAYSAAIQVFVNAPNATGTPFRDFYPSIPFPSGINANSLVRQGIHDKYGIDHTSIPVNRFVVGTNTITLVQRRAASATSSYVFYDYLSLESPVPGAPNYLTATPEDAQVGLDWPAMPGATGYSLQRSTNNGISFSLLTSLTTTNFTDTNVKNGSNYVYYVVASNANGSSGNSTLVSARPVATNSPSMNVVVGSGQLQISWPADHLGWRLEVQTNSLSTGLGTNWVTVRDSTKAIQMNLSIGDINAGVFYRLVYP